MTETQTEYQVNDKRIQETREVAVPEPSFMAILDRMSTRPDIDPARIKQFMDMQERIVDKRAEQLFNAAMVRAQKDMPIVPKDATGGSSNKYSKYETLLKYAKPIYTREGFALMLHQGYGTPENPIAEKHIRILCDVMHNEGCTKIVFVDVPVDTEGPKGGKIMTETHATGSGFAYGKRYLVLLIFNIPTGDDDDGNAAGGGSLPTPFEQWQIKCDESATAKSDMGKWWSTNKIAIQKELSDAQAPKIYKAANAYKKQMDAEKAAPEPGSDG